MSRKRRSARALIVATDIFTGTMIEHWCPASHNLDVPCVKRTEYQLLCADSDTEKVCLLLDRGSTKDDLCLPIFAKGGEPTHGDKVVSAELLLGLEDGKHVTAIVLAACGEEKIVQVELTDPHLMEDSTLIIKDRVRPRWANLVDDVV